ncbi:MAG: response regulator transcription factor [Salinivirgaceae bacterium]|jgi:DNA-binding response OmpR family regulator|nr:response regulator transcription factor [Salinivirgaceae bacterium]
MNDVKEHNKSILYVEDDPALAFVTKDNLEQFGYKVMHFDNGQLALNNFAQHEFNLCVLDIMLPKMDGYELAKRIREINTEIPILFLSAKSQTEDKIHGLKIGADDYITKPFNMEELRLKVEVFLKRQKIIEVEEKQQLIKVGKYTLDLSNQLLAHEKAEKKLTLRETTLLKMLFMNSNTILKRNEILKKIWGDDSYFNGRSLDVFMSRIRKYLAYDEKLQVENIRSIGFRLNVLE